MDSSWPYTIALLASGLISIALAGYGWKHRAIKGALSFTCLMLAAALYSIAYGAELASVTVEQMLLWIRLEYFGMVFLCPLWLVMVLNFVGKRTWLRGWIKLVLFIIPITTVVLVATNEWHHLHFAAASVDASGPFPLLHTVKGPWYWVNNGYFALCLAASTVLLLERYHHAAAVYRKSILVMLTAAAITWFSSLIYLAGLSPYGIDLTPFGTIISAPLLIVGLIRFRVLELIPVARELVFDHMGDGVIVLNAQRRIVDANAVASSLLAISASEMIGQEIHSLKDLASSITEVGFDAISSTGLFALPGLRSERSDGSQERRLEVRQTTIRDLDGELAGSMLFLRDVTARVLAEEPLRQSHGQLVHMATHDPLTGLANRTLFHERLTEAMAEAQSTGSGIAVLMLDLDGFKKVNDTLGHSAGDEVLKLVAKRLAATARTGDTISRFAGDEFLILIVGITSLDAVRSVADRLLRTINAPMKVDGHLLRISGSIGLALYPEQELVPEDLIRQADRAMYAAKRSRDRVCAMGEASSPTWSGGPSNARS